VVVTTVLAIVRSRPEDMGLLPDGEVTNAVRAAAGAGREIAAGFDLPQAVKTNAFWILSLGHFLGVFASFSIVGHLVAFLRDLGFDSRVAAASLGLAVGVSVIGRVLVGFLADRSSKRHMASAAYALYAVATLLLLSIQSAGALPAFIITFGLGLGGAAVMVPLLVGECFGLLAFGKLLGVIMISGTLGGAAGPVLTGRIYDVTGSYNLAFMLHAAVFLAAALAFHFLPRPEMPEPATNSAG
jgi:MFS family permease